MRKTQKNISFHKKANYLVNVEKNKIYNENKRKFDFFIKNMKEFSNRDDPEETLKKSTSTLLVPKQYFDK